jgi:hypothetical protein
VFLQTLIQKFEKRRKKIKTHKTQRAKVFFHDTVIEKKGA